MANTFQNGQAAPSIPAMIGHPRGRHRATGPRRRNVVLTHMAVRSSGVEPSPVAPFPPLLSGGWNHGLTLTEELGPGQYPVESSERSVGAALALSVVGGPLGLCYTSVLGGAVCLMLTGIGLVVFGLGALLAGWLLAIAWASASLSTQFWSESD